MSDYISRQAAIELINGLPKWPDAVSINCLDYEDVISVLSDREKLPSADVKENITSEWKWDSYIGFYYCEKCGAVAPKEDQAGNYIEDLPKFCYQCGCKMENGWSEV